MAADTICRMGVLAIAFLAATLLLLPADAAAGQCSGQNRVDHADAECLYAWWNNRGLLRNSPWHVSNQCPAYGKVVAKVDLVAARDRTIHLPDSLPRDGDTRHRIRGIYCCSDMGVCNRSDVNDENCLARFLEASPAAQNLNCLRHTATAVAGEDGTCTVTAQCDVGVHPYIPLYTTTSITVPWPELDDVYNCRGVLTRGMCRPSVFGISASDAGAVEAGGATLDFRVTLSQPFPETVTVRFYTSDDEARAGQDYVAASGTLVFAPGETSKTVSVQVLDDDLDEAREAMRLWLSHATPAAARVQRNGIGWIFNADPMPGAWIARFGRTVAEQVLDAVDARMRTKPAPGVGANLAGHRIGGAAVPDDAVGHRDRTRGRSLSDRLKGGTDPQRQNRDSNTATERDLLTGSSFALTAEAGGGGLVSIWGRGAVTRFDGREGDLAVGGEVASSMLGADWTEGAWKTGLLVSHSRGEGGYRDASAGNVSSTLTGIFPWANRALGERLSVWGAAGYGAGSLMLEPEGQPKLRTDLDLWMAAAGLRGVLIDGGHDGPTLAATTDATIVRTSSDAVTGRGGNLAAAETEVTRLRLGLQGSQPSRLAEGATLTPSVEIGVRQEGGDAETGFGLDVGGGLAWSDTARGIAAEVRGRGLLTYEADGFRERGLSGALSWDPQPASDRGPRALLTQTLGGPASGGIRALRSRETLAGLAAGDPGSANDLRRRRLEARFGYGFAAFGGGFTSLPEIALGLSNAGRDYGFGWRLFRGGGPGGGSLELSVEAERRETANDDIAPEHAVGFRIDARY